LEQILADKNIKIGDIELHDEFSAVKHHIVQSEFTAFEL
jgi:hypothetical protein